MLQRAVVAAAVCLGLFAGGLSTPVQAHTPTPPGAHSETHGGPQRGPCVGPGCAVTLFGSGAVRVGKQSTGCVW